MKALRFYAPEDVRLEDVPEPTCAPDEVKMRVRNCSTCGTDVKIFYNGHQNLTPPRTIGHEIAGEIVEVGADVNAIYGSNWQEGDRVQVIAAVPCGECHECRKGWMAVCQNQTSMGYQYDGGFAEYVALSEYSLVKLPEGLDPVGAALLACPMGVALQAVRETAQVAPGETVVVTGAGGGLGVHAVQAAAALGARVLAVSSSPEKENALRELGAAEVLEINGLDFAELVMAMTGDEGADVVIDTVGSALFPSTLRSLAQYGRLVLLGEVLGQHISLNPAEIIFRDARLIGASGVSRATVEQAVLMALEGRLRTVVDLEMPLEQATDAYRLVSERRPTGRIVLLPNG